MAEGFSISRDFAERAIRVIKRIEDTPYAGGVTKVETRFEGDAGVLPTRVRVGKTTSAWNKGTLAEITLYEEGTPPNETAKSPAETLAGCVNKFANVASGKWVIVARAKNGSWYLISAECG